MNPTSPTPSDTPDLTIHSQQVFHFALALAYDPDHSAQHLENLLDYILDEVNTQELDLLRQSSALAAATSDNLLGRILHLSFALAHDADDTSDRMQNLLEVIFDNQEDPLIQDWLTFIQAIARSRS